MREIRLFVAALQRFKVGPGNTEILAMFAPLPPPHSPTNRMALETLKRSIDVTHNLIVEMNGPKQ